MAKKKIMTAAQLVRTLQQQVKFNDKVAKTALAQLMRAAGPNGKKGGVLILPGVGPVVWAKVRAKGRVGVAPQSIAKKAVAARKKFRRAKVDARGLRRWKSSASGRFTTLYRRPGARGVRQVKSPAKRSSIGISLIRDAVVTASIGE
ncbi:MAG: hypothetical protein A3H28_02745 [Acidobacteria bacterium RIFCSPLOWO2_02_FULL_61_28]|nr:MAG: hypothetical protein A3H28_02745 [Acidobacteria bacterium RIFCSPLOWO2_02_FULL_61_28]